MVAVQTKANVHHGFAPMMAGFQEPTSFAIPTFTTTASNMPRKKSPHNRKDSHRSVDRHMDKSHAFANSVTAIHTKYNGCDIPT